MYKGKGVRHVITDLINSFEETIHVTIVNHYKLLYIILFTFAEESFTSTAVQVHIALQTTFIS